MNYLHRHLPHALLVALIAGSMACDSAETKRNEEAYNPRSILPQFAGEVIERHNGWLEVKPGGETICSRGTDYSYFVKPGVTDKVLVEFQGGGGCWDSITCSIAGSIFTEDVEAIRAGAGLYQQGIYDHTNPENPFAGWTHVYVPYCTGDVHWGNQEYDYGSFTIQHKGFANASSAMSWINAKIEAPS